METSEFKINLNYFLVSGIALYVISFFLPVTGKIEYGYKAAWIVLTIKFWETTPVLISFLKDLFFNSANIAFLTTLILSKKQYYKRSLLFIPVIGFASAAYWYFFFVENPDSLSHDLQSGYFMWATGQFFVYIYFVIKLFTPRSEKLY